MYIISYLLQTCISICLFYLLYKLLFRNDNFLTIRRWFILFSVIISLFLPNININNSLSASMIANNPKIIEYSISEVIIKGSFLSKQNIINYIKDINYISLFLYIYIAGVVFGLFLFIFRLINFLNLISNSKNNYKTEGMNIIGSEVKTPFSFFNYIIINNSNYNSKEILDIIIHEKQHYIQYHSIDIIFFEIISIILWFNPFIFLFRSELKIVHEFLADRGTLQSGVEVNTYLNLLFKETTGHEINTIGNFFNKNLTKKRIIMMSRRKQSILSVVKLITIIPVLLILLLSFNVVKESSNIELSSNIATFKGDFAAQKYPINLFSVENDSIYSMPEKLPEFQGGLGALYTYLSENIKLPDNLKNVDFEGLSFISFIIEKDGFVSNVEIKRSCGNKECDDLALDIVKKMPRWIPGRNVDNELVRVSFMLPVKFVSNSK